MVLLSLLLSGLWTCRSYEQQTQKPAGTLADSTRQDSTLAAADNDSIAVADSVAEIFGINEKWTGDWDGMLARRRIRALVAYSKTLYFVDRGERHGLSFEALKKFEAVLNEQFAQVTPTINLVFVPVTRDELLPALVEGRGDLVAANLTITPERLQMVDFSEPLLNEVSEVVVTGPASPSLDSLADLSGKEVHVRASSSYYESLQRLNASLLRAGKPPVQINRADEILEDEDLLEMTDAGLIPLTIVDSHKAGHWQTVLDSITVRHDLAVNTGGKIAWALRKNSPKLRQVVNAFVQKHKAGTLYGNIALRRYLGGAPRLSNATSEKERAKFRATIGLFQKYAGQYGFDWLLLAAQGYQESRLDQSVHSPAGAVGIMQVKPSTARDPNVNIPDITNAENNIHAGIKYMRFMMDRYFQDARMDTLNKTLLALASYNAGPSRIAGLRSEARQRNLDPNAWFNHVELVAARRIGRETVSYVSNIYKYYLSYRLLLEHLQMQTGSRAQLR
jgi:membrane-bound lytic murein transglycosylase MltF